MRDPILQNLYILLSIYLFYISIYLSRETRDGCDGCPCLVEQPRTIYISLYILLSIYIPYYLSIYLTIYLSIYLSYYLSNYISIYLSRETRDGCDGCPGPLVNARNRTIYLSLSIYLSIYPGKQGMVVTGVLVL